jgi:hypothetical protein
VRYCLNASRRAEHSSTDSSTFLKIDQWQQEATELPETVSIAIHPKSAGGPMQLESKVVNSKRTLSTKVGVRNGGQNQSQLQRAEWRPFPQSGSDCKF